ncbi:selenot [Pungitius sinensis]
MKWLRCSLLVLGVFSLCCATSGDHSGVKRMKLQFASGPLLKFQICIS